jgi:arginyl-tRNA synthetase
MDEDIYAVCNLSSQYHFQMALEDKPQSSLCCLQACTSSFQVKGNYMDFMVESMYQKLVDKVIGSDNATTRKLAESKFHLLFYAVKKTKKLDLDQQCESNETGIHLQYSIARIEGIRKYLESDHAFIESDKCVSESDLDALFEQFPKSSVLFNMLEIFEEKLLQSIFEPSLLVSYASSLSKLISSLYYHLRIKGEDVDTQKVRWFLFEKSFAILSTILNLLHVEPVKKI